MWAMFILAALMFVLVAGGVFSDYASKQPTPPAPPEVVAEVSALNAFAKGALLYTEINGVPASAIRWDTIKAVTQNKGLPKAFESLAIDTAAGSYWKIVPDGKGSFLVCAELSAEGIAQVARLLPPADPPLVAHARSKTSGSNTLDMQVFAAHSSDADAGAESCK